MLTYKKVSRSKDPNSSLKFILLKARITWCYFRKIRGSLSSLGFMSIGKQCIPTEKVFVWVWVRSFWFRPPVVVKKLCASIIFKMFFRWVCGEVLVVVDVVFALVPYCKPEVDWTGTKCVRIQNPGNLWHFRCWPAISVYVLCFIHGGRGSLCRRPR